MSATRSGIALVDRGRQRPCVFVEHGLDARFAERQVADELGEALLQRDVCQQPVKSNLAGWTEAVEHGGEERSRST